MFARTAAAFLFAATIAHAQTTPDPAPAADKLVLLFDAGSASIRMQDVAILDQASRTFRDGKPIVMVISGGADLTGEPTGNLLLSQSRANAVLRGLVARGIPADRFQVVAKGETDPVIATPRGTAEPRNRRVEISWR